MIRDLSLIATATPFSFKQLFTRPLRYLIQMVTGSRIEHVAIYCQDSILQAIGSGVELISFDEFKLKHKDSNIYKFQFIKEIKTEQIFHFYSFAEKNLGKDYSAFQAAYSALDKLVVGENIEQDDKWFCSELCAKLYEELSWIKIDETKTNPKELIRFLNDLHLTNGREKCE